jgi:hypothetical protein
LPYCFTAMFAICLFHIPSIDPLNLKDVVFAQLKVGWSFPNYIWSKMQLSNWSKYLGFQRSPPHITPFYKVNCFSMVALFCQVCNVP